MLNPLPLNLCMLLFHVHDINVKEKKFFFCSLACLSSTQCRKCEKNKRTVLKLVTSAVKNQHIINHTHWQVAVKQSERAIYKL